MCYYFLDGERWMCSGEMGFCFYKSLYFIYSDVRVFQLNKSFQTENICALNTKEKGEGNYLFSSI